MTNKETGAVGSVGSPNVDEAPSSVPRRNRSTGHPWVYREFRASPCLKNSKNRVRWEPTIIRSRKTEDKGARNFNPHVAAQQQGFRMQPEILKDALKLLASGRC